MGARPSSANDCNPQCSEGCTPPRTNQCGLPVEPALPKGLRCVENPEVIATDGHRAECVPSDPVLMTSPILDMSTAICIDSSAVGAVWHERGNVFRHGVEASLVNARKTGWSEVVIVEFDESIPSPEGSVMDAIKGLISQYPSSTISVDGDILDQLDANDLEQWTIAGLFQELRMGECESLTKTSTKMSLEFLPVLLVCELQT